MIKIIKFEIIESVLTSPISNCNGNEYINRNGSKLANVPSHPGKSARGMNEPDRNLMVSSIKRLKGHISRKVNAMNPINEYIIMYRKCPSTTEITAQRMYIGELNPAFLDSNGIKMIIIGIPLIISDEQVLPIIENTALI